MKNLLWAVSAMLSFGGANAIACSCAAPGAPKAALANSNTVLQGTVESVKKVAVGEHGYAQNLVTFKVEQSWKGLHAYHRKMTIRTSISSAACGYGFKTGESYVVYASLSSEGELHTNLCTRNALTVKATDDLKELGAGVKPK